MTKPGLEPKSVASRLSGPAPCPTVFPIAFLLSTYTHASALEVPVQVKKHLREAPGITVPLCRSASPRFRKIQGLQLCTRQSRPPNSSPCQRHPPHKALVSLHPGGVGWSRAPLPGPSQGKVSKALLLPRGGMVGKSFCFSRSQLVHLHSGDANLCWSPSQNTLK